MKHSKRYINKLRNKNRKKELINKKILAKIIENSSICKHAIKELNLAGYHANDCGPNSWMYNQVLEAVAVFASHSNSGFSAPYEIGMVKKLCEFGILTPLTLKDDEFINEYGSCRNIRDSSLFKENDGRIHYLYAFRKRTVNRYSYDTKEWEENENPTTRHGGFWLSNNGILTGEYVSKCYIKPESYPNGYMPDNTIYIDCNEIEIEKDSWIMTVDYNNDKYKELCNLYNVEVNFAPALKGIKDINVTPQLEELAYQQLKEYNK